jgi:hypothetical protein
MSQTSVDEQSTALIGQKGNLVPDKVLSYAAEGRVGFGRFTSLGTDLEKQVKLPVLATDITSIKSKRGVALQSHGIENQNNSLDAGYEDKDTVSVIAEGHVYVEVEADVLVSSDVYVRHAVDVALDQLGIFAPAAGTGLAQLANARWLAASETIDGKKVALLELL